MNNSRKGLHAVCILSWEETLWKPTVLLWKFGCVETRSVKKPTKQNPITSPTVFTSDSDERNTNYRICTGKKKKKIGSLRLEKTCKILKSNSQHIPTSNSQYDRAAARGEQKEISC